MRWSGKFFQANLIALTGLVIICLCFGLLLYQPDVITRVNNLIYDKLMTHAAPRAPHPDIVIVDIDEKSLDREGQWPWPRTLLTHLLDRLLDAGVRAIGLDIILSEKDRTSPVWINRQLEKEYGTSLDLSPLPESALDNDALFSEYLKGKPLVMGVYANFEGPVTLHEQVSGIKSLTVRNMPDANPGEIPEARSLTLPLESFAKAATIGLVNAPMGTDGVIRSVPMATRVGSEFLPALSLSTLGKALGIDKSPVLKIGPEGIERLAINKSVIPVDTSGIINPRYRGPGRTYPYISASDILDGSIDGKELNGKIAFVGFSAVGLQDLRATPYDPLMPGVEVHATVLDNILSGDGIKINRDDAGWQFLVVLGATFIAVPLFGLLPAVICLPVGCLLLFGYVWLTHYIFEQGFFITPFYALLATILAALILLPARFWREQKAKKKIRSAFSLYVPSEVVARISSQGVDILKGEQRRLTIMFTDIRGFTTISEKMSPDRIVRLLNSYFSSMTACVIERQGTLDKFIGDALMAFWNAPLDVENHESKAVEAAIDMQEKLAELRPRFQAEFGIELKMGAGIHTGMVQVGNMGSSDLLNYTCIGDNVNLASRLEGLCKRYGVGIVVSADIVDACPKDMPFRQLDRIRVKGSSRPLGIFTPLTDASDYKGEKEWSEALKTYFSGDFARAEILFQKLQANDKFTTACALFIERVQFLIDNPPEMWEGVWTYETK